MTPRTGLVDEIVLDAGRLTGLVDEIVLDAGGLTGLGDEIVLDAGLRRCLACVDDLMTGRRVPLACTRRSLACSLLWRAISLFFNLSRRSLSRSALRAAMATFFAFFSAASCTSDSLCKERIQSENLELKYVI